QTVLGAGMVKDALVVTGADPAGETILVAYLIEHPGRPLMVDVLRAALREKLPHYMVPSAFVTLEAWPLTPNGKVDHKRLPAPERRRSSTIALETASTQAERTVLEVEDVGVADNFFDLGGHSLLLARMREELARHFPRRLTLPDLFRLPTVRLLAAELASEESGPDFTEQTARASRQRQALGRFRRQQQSRA
ncbi:MAG: phosphopantetheine-binding protein, partial [Geminicoccaceae bacterium]|nr:phosphopantetheine-binding protein [Geminicoccaceae bacterium]